MSGSTAETRTYKLVIAYHGARFRGWQKGNGRTVQSTLLTVIQKALPEASGGDVPETAQVRLDGAGRTDAGVHAEGQVASLVLPAVVDAERLFALVNHHLPADLTVISLEQVDDRFHARYRATAKTYRYTVLDGPVGDPFLQDRAWRYDGELDVGRMQEAARVFVGRHDFSAFTADRPKPGKERTVFSVTIARRGVAGGAGASGGVGASGSALPRGVTTPAGSRLHAGQARSPIDIHVRGSAFLWRQVRMMVGGIVEVGAGRLGTEDLARILASRDRSLGPAPAPACGLTLETVEFEGD
ncbi:MAG: tRNA pseudouridine synthase A [bacterium]